MSSMDVLLAWERCAVPVSAHVEQNTSFVPNFQPRGQVNHFSRAAPEKIPCKYMPNFHGFLLTQTRRYHPLQERDAPCFWRS
jgi:hypothetical protein